MHTVSVLVIQSFNLEIIHIIQVIYRGQFPKDDFSESSEVSTYIEELSNEDSSLENLQTVTTDLEEFTHQKLVATISAPPSFSPVSWTAPGPGPLVIVLTLKLALILILRFSSTRSSFEFFSKLLNY